MVHIKDLFLLIKRVAHICGGSDFPLSLFMLSVTIYLM